MKTLKKSLEKDVPSVCEIKRTTNKRTNFKSDHEMYVKQGMGFPYSINLLK